jgi:PKD repeat protein
MKRLILLLLFFVTCSVASYGQITFSSLTEVAAADSVDTSAQIVLVNPTSNIPVWRGSVGELLKAISRVGEVIATGSIIDGTITDADIASGADIGIEKLDTTSADGVVSKSRLSNALDDVVGGGSGNFTGRSVQSITADGTDTLNFASYWNTIFQLNLSGVSYSTLTLINPVNGGTYSLDLDNVTIDSILFPSNFLNANEDTLGTIIFTDGELISFYYDGTNYITPETPGTTAGIPVANFTANQTTVFENEIIRFTNSSSEATSYSWTFTSGTPSSSTDENPSVYYANSGTYSPQLTASNVAGVDTLIRTGYINVIEDTIMLYSPWAYYNIDNVNVADNAYVDSIPDLSGNNRHLLQSDSTKQAVYLASEVSTSGALDFDGSDIYFSSDSIQWTSDSITIVAIYKYSSSNATSENLLSMFRNENPNKGWALGDNSTDAFDQFIQSDDGINLNSLRWESVSTSYAVHALRIGNSVEDLAKNNADQTESSVNSPQSSMVDHFNYLALGGFGEPGSESASFDGQLLILAIYDKYLSNTQIDNIESFLNNAFSIY